MAYRTQVLAFVFGAFAALAAPSTAHAQVGVNIQIGRPAWGPAVPQGAQYYYIPEIDGYYDLAARNYIVQRNGGWVPVATLPGYDPYQFHPVIVNDYRGRQPWVRYRDYHARYYRPVVVQPRPVIVERGRGYGNPHGLPPGQAKKLYRDGYREGRNDDNRGRDNRGRGRH